MRTKIDKMRRRAGAAYAEAKDRGEPCRLPGHRGCEWVDGMLHHHPEDPAYSEAKERGGYDPGVEHAALLQEISDRQFAALAEVTNPAPSIDPSWDLITAGDGEHYRPSPDRVSYWVNIFYPHTVKHDTELKALGPVRQAVVVTLPDVAPDRLAAEALREFAADVREWCPGPKRMGITEDENRCYCDVSTWAEERAAELLAAALKVEEEPTDD